MLYCIILKKLGILIMTAVNC